MYSAGSDGKVGLSPNNCGVVGMSGTSMATPVTTGAAALIREFFRGGKFNSEPLQPSAALIKVGCKGIYIIFPPSFCLLFIRLISYLLM